MPSVANRSGMQPVPDYDTNRPMNGGLTVTPVSLPVGAFPVLEAMFPPGSSDSEKAAYLLSLFQMALQPEDDV